MRGSMLSGKQASNCWTVYDWPLLAITNTLPRMLNSRFGLLLCIICFRFSLVGAIIRPHSCSEANELITRQSLPIGTPLSIPARCAHMIHAIRIAIRCLFIDDYLQPL